MNHIRRARKRWTCRRCGKAITKGMRHFANVGTSLPYGRYITSMVEYRVHLECLTEADFCCKEARKEVAALPELERQPQKTQPVSMPEPGGSGEACDALDEI